MSSTTARVTIGDDRLDTVAREAAGTDHLSEVTSAEHCRARCGVHQAVNVCSDMRRAANRFSGILVQAFPTSFGYVHPTERKRVKLPWGTLRAPTN